MKVKRLQISPELLFQLFAAGEHRGYYVGAGAVPCDAELVNVRHAWPNMMELLIRSESFEEVVLGQEIPPLELTVGVQADA
jgi:hypothetical protein